MLGPFTASDEAISTEMNALGAGGVCQSKDIREETSEKRCQIKVLSIKNHELKMARKASKHPGVAKSIIEALKGRQLSARGVAKRNPGMRRRSFKFWRVFFHFEKTVTKRQHTEIIGIYK